MKFDKETLIILGTCMVLMLAWPSISEFMGWSKPAAKPQTVSEVETPAPAVQPAPTPAPKPVVQPAPKPVAAAAPVPVKFRTLENAELAAAVSEATGAVEKLTFLRYRNSDRSALIAVSAAGPDGALFRCFFPQIPTSAADTAVSGTGDSLTVSRVLTIPQGRVRVTQTVTLEPNYTLRARIVFAAVDGPILLPEAVVSGGSLGSWHAISGDKIRAVSHRLDYFTAKGEFDDIKADKDDEDFFLNPAPTVRWAGVSNKYFCLLIHSENAFPLWQQRWFPDGNRKEPVIAAGARVPAVTLMPNAPRTVEFTAYAGPKIADNLAAFAPDAGKVMHLAWGPLNYLARFLLWILTLLQHLCGSYGLSIIILTLLVRTAFYPLTARGNESMKKMQKVQPKFKELREKYKDNPQLLNQKMAELYRQEGVNPFAGCLPILLQIPIFFALYAMLDNVIALRHVSFLWCRNLAAADTIFRIPLFVNVPLIGSSIPVNPLALAMTVLMVVQQRMTPMSMDPMQKKMMLMMPVIMLLFLYDLPSGLTLYWTVSNIFSIVQLWLQKRRGQTPADARSK